ncbi:G-protein coupled receptor Mth isoform X5 [Agrilus planipennis]|uniref:G-protein coupled receptor Mth isoform X5 n=1 Tax=Agrilus planipennis TaxID=224129 RepID=A0A1W4X335_AGRPL|nr:G-protein coupled receptor Mth isoform X5 [Agrilus planipennis]
MAFGGGTLIAFFCIVIVIYITAVSAENPCSEEFSVDISDGIVSQDNSIVKDGVTYSAGQYYYYNSTNIRGCVCEVKKCIRKCCPIGEYMTNKTCLPTDQPLILPGDTPPNINDYHVLVGSTCPENKVRTRASEDNDDIALQNDGTLIAFGNGYSYEDYCVDYIEDLTRSSALVCIEPTAQSTQHSVGMIISLPCLFITFLVYFLDPNRNFHGMCLMCYVSTLFCAYVFLIILQLHSDFEMSVCTALGILCYFFFLVSFFWLNIMCIHMWRIGGQQNFSRSKKANRNRFLAYSAYAWGVPLIMTGIVVALRFSFPEESNWLPSIGIRQCWFNDDLQSLIYFYGPVTVLITINITLFAITAIKILKAKKDTAILRKDEKERKTLLQRFLHRGPIKRSIQVEGFNLYSKLVLAMGVNWAMEVISFYFRFVDHMSPKWIWYFTDFCNACYGVFIFFVYAFKKVWTICKVRYYKMTGKPYEEKTVTQSTPRTVTSNVSYATSNNAESTAMIS